MWGCIIMGKAPAFQFYASDFYMDTIDWTIAETGIYIRLLMSQWINIDLPPEMPRLARIAGCDTRTMQKCWNQCTAKKFNLNDTGRLQNYKLEEIRKTRQDFVKKQEESGRLGGLKTQKNRRKKPSNASSNASTQKQPLQSSSSSSSSIKIKNYLSDASIRLSSLLFDCIKINNLKSKFHNFNNTDSDKQIMRWAIDTDKMLRIDNRSEEDCENVIRFSTSDDFWSANILSASKLRKQFDQLYIKMNQGSKTGGKVSNVTPGNFDSAEPVFAKLLEEKRIEEERERNENPIN